MLKLKFTKKNKPAAADVARGRCGVKKQSTKSDGSALRSVLSVLFVWPEPSVVRSFLSLKPITSLFRRSLLPFKAFKRFPWIRSDNVERISGQSKYRVEEEVFTILLRPSPSSPGTEDPSDSFQGIVQRSGIMYLQLNFAQSSPI